MKSDMTKLDKRILEYGRAREWRQLNRMHKAESQLISEIQGTILDTIKECEREANSWLMAYSGTEGISLAEAKKAVKLKDIRELEAKAKEYVKRRQDLGFAFSEEAMKEMRRYNFGMKMNRLELLQHNLALALGMGTVDVEEIIGKHLTYATEEELSRQAGLLGLNVPDPEILRANAEAIVNASFHDETFSQRIWSNKRELEQALTEGIRKSVMLGQNPLTWARSLKGLLRDTENDAMYRMKRLAITESGRVQIEAQKQSYDMAGYSNYMVICEPTACPHCMEFDGEIFPLSELVQGVNSPMFHPFCRCSTTPYMSREEVEAGFRELEKIKDRGYEDITQDVLRDNIPGLFKTYFLEEVTIGGKTYKVDNKYVVQDHTDDEIRLAEWIAQEIGGRVGLCPRIIFPPATKTPDYIWNNEKWDLKTIRGTGKNTLTTAIGNAKGQAPNVILDIAPDLYSETWILKEMERVYLNARYSHIDKIMITTRQALQFIFQRK